MNKKRRQGVIPINEFMDEVKGLTAEEYRNKVKRNGVRHTGNLGKLETNIISGEYDRESKNNKIDK